MATDPQPSSQNPEPPAGLARPDLWTSLQAFPRGFWILVIGMFINRCGTFVIPFLTLYVRGLGFPAASAGLALTLYGLGHLASSILGGQFADQFGRRRCIVVSMLTTAACMLALGQARAFPQLLGAAFATGFTAELARPAASALIADLVPTPHRVTAYAVYRLAINAGWGLGPALGGLLAASSYAWLFIGDALTSALFGLLAWQCLPQGRISAQHESDWLPALQTLWRDKRLIRVLLASLITGFAFMQMSSTFSLQVTGVGLSPAVFGMLASLNGLLIVAFELPLTRLTQQLPTRPTIAAGFLLVGLGFSLNTLAASVPMFVLVVMTFTFGEMLSLPLASAYVADLAPDHLRGRYQGAYGLSWAAALVLAPATGVALFEWHPPFLWAGCGLCGLLAALIIVRD